MQTDDELITWLLCAETPTIHYQARRDLLGQLEEAAPVAQARQAIGRSGPVPAILRGQAPSGVWRGERSFYTPKYVSTHWSLMLLAELDVDSGEARFGQGVRAMLAATARDLKQPLADRTPGWSCFWGNLLRYALHAGQAGAAPDS